MKRWIKTSELAEILDISPQTIWNRRSAGDHDLFNKGFVPPGGKGLRWRRVDVEKWLDQQEKAAIG